MHIKQTSLSKSQYEGQQAGLAIQDQNQEERKEEEDFIIQIVKRAKEEKMLPTKRHEQDKLPGKKWRPIHR